MKILFDNNVPAPLRDSLAGHRVSTAAEHGWAELRNGDLLNAAENAAFDLFVTGDKNLAYQQNLKARTIAIVVLATTHWPTLESDPTSVLRAVDLASPGSFQQIESA